MQQLLQADGTDVLALKDGDVFGAVTENAGGLIFLQHDGRPVNVDLQRILFCDVQRAAQLDREDDSPQFVDPADNTCGFHVCKALPFPDGPFFLSLSKPVGLSLRRGGKNGKKHKKLLETP